MAEIAGLLKLNQQTVRNWIDEGRLPAIRVGRRVRVLRLDLDQMLESGYRRPAVPRTAGNEGFSAEDFWEGTAVRPEP